MKSLASLLAAMVLVACSGPGGEGRPEAAAAPAGPSPRPAPATSGGPHAPPLPLERRSSPIDLVTALRLANARNPQIALAQELVNEASAQLDQARLALLPNLNAGGSYDHHDGRIQETAGTVLEASRNSGFAGLGAGAVGAGPVLVPGLSLRSDLAEAIFLPLWARQNLRAQESGRRVVEEEVLLQVTLGYLELLRAKAALAIARESLVNAEDLARLTEGYARSGEGLQSDAERAAVERSLQEREVERGREGFQVRSAQLAELLDLDASLELDPLDAGVAPLEVVPEGASLETMIQTALQNRPEIERSRALVGLASERLSQARLGPLIPKVLLGFSAGGYGGGAGSRFGEFGDRTDFDAIVYWELRNLGFGNAAQARERRAQYQEARASETAVRLRVPSEVSQAQAQVVSRKKQIAIAAGAVERALGSYRLNRARIHEKQGLPIETLQAIQSLAATRRNYLDAVIDYNQAQFRLYTALGEPARQASPLPAANSPAVPVIPPAEKG